MAKKPYIFVIFRGGGESGPLSLPLDPRMCNCSSGHSLFADSILITKISSTAPFSFNIQNYKISSCFVIFFNNRTILCKYGATFFTHSLRFLSNFLYLFGFT